MFDKLVRFVLASVINNVVTILIYQGLLFVTSASISFIVAYAVGLVMVVLFYPQHVFRVADPTLRDKATVFSIYIASFVVGLIIVRLMDYDPLLARVSIFFVLISNFVINFGVGTFYLSENKKNAQERD